MGGVVLIILCNFAVWNNKNKKNERVDFGSR